MKVIANITEGKYTIPRELADKMGVINIHTSDILARIIGHSCTQPGLSYVFSGLFDSGRADIYSIPAHGGKTFGETVMNAVKSVPVGYIRKKKIFLNPPAQTELERGDSVLYIESKSADKTLAARIAEQKKPTGDAPAKIVVIGYNSVFDVLLSELPEEPFNMTVAKVTDEEKERILLLSGHRRDVNVGFSRADTGDMTALRRILEGANHVVILADNSVTKDESDVAGIILYTKVAGIRRELNADYNITVEFFSKKNSSLVVPEESTDFIVSSDLTDMILVRLSQNPGLYDMFTELLSNEGSEIMIKMPSELGIECENMPAPEMRQAVLDKGYVLLGACSGNDFDFNLEKDESVSSGHSLVVIGEK